MKVLFAIFAHPDDEAFGPSGTLLREAKNGTSVRLCSITCGQAGQNPDNVENLGAVREKEWRAAGALIGADAMHHLKYCDGTLNNEDMVKIAETVSELAQTMLAELGPDDELEFMTNDINGITGHIDHIVAARATSQVFYRLKKADTRVTKLRMVCVPRERQPDINVDWIFAEPGRTENEINETIDNREFHDEIVAIMRCHETQREDLEHHLKDRGNDIGLDHFMVRR